MNKQTLKIIVAWETILMIVLSLLFGYIMGLQLRKINQIQNQLDEKQTEINMLIDKYTTKRR